MTFGARTAIPVEAEHLSALVTSTSNFGTVFESLDTFFMVTTNRL